MIDIDLADIEKECDYCICCRERSAADGAGTKGEITLAKYLGKPVFLVSEIPFSAIPGWVLGCSREMFRNFLELKIFLAASFGKEAAK